MTDDQDIIFPDMPTIGTPDFDALQNGQIDPATIAISTDTVQQQVVDTPQPNGNINIVQPHPVGNAEPQGILVAPISQNINVSIGNATASTGSTTSVPLPHGQDSATPAD